MRQNPNSKRASTQPYSVHRRNQNLPNTYALTYECGESHERMQSVSACCRNPSSFSSYSVVETRFSQNSALTYHFLIHL
ncbi:unnamed protein product [Hymenolepis diminuta]|uniref:Uncharacterized protein n=1 Tax=Hymenolepis diminuta TaxID=6216 RepID=A0A564YEW9_HYMDI|nr:unnamed protein product [Hymenolepis diminuta]